jgi:hypothetical protein
VTNPPALRRSATEERFLVGIAGRLPAERVVEVHLFPPIRQGPVESGVAVVAIEAPPETGVAINGAQTRLVVYTATYVHKRKGPERGAWSMEMTALADAPLEAVGKVVHGVQRRTADEGLADAERLSGDEFRALVCSLAPSVLPAVTGTEAGVGVREPPAAGSA